MWKEGCVAEPYLYLAAAYVLLGCSSLGTSHHTEPLAFPPRMSRVFDNGGDVSISRMRVGSITVHCSTPQPRSHVDDYYDSEEEGRYLLTPDRGRSRSGSRSRSTSRERAGYGEGG